MSLDELSVKYGTDKGSLKHNYMPFYELHLPKEPKRILEIGVAEGRSMAMWGEYFPNAEIYGLDLFSETSHETVFRNLDHWFDGDWDINRFHLHTGDQCDWVILDSLRHFDFDVIIDDGSHNSRDQMMTFFGLFNGKHYFIEDLHCCQEEFYQQGLPQLFTAYSLFGEMNGNDLDSFCTGRNIILSKDQKIACVCS